MYKLYGFLEAIDNASPVPPNRVFAAHGKDAAQLLQQTVPETRGYVQTRSLATQPGDEPPAYAGALELFFDSKEAALEVYRNCQDLQPLWNADQVRLGAALLGTVRVVMRLPSHHGLVGVKGVFPFRRRADLSVADFQAHWWHRHGPIAAHTQDALYYPQCHPLPSCYESDQPSFDGVTELHWRDYETGMAAMQSNQMQQDQANDAKNFVEDGSVVLFFGVEEVIDPP